MSDFTAEQTTELETMFQRCGFEGAEWVDFPGWLIFTVQVPLTGGGVLTGLKQSVGSYQGADFYLRFIQTIGLTDPTNGPQVWAQIKLPSGRYLQSGNQGNVTAATGFAGTLNPGPLGLVKPECPCPGGSQFTIDLVNLSATFNPPGAAITVSIIFWGVYRYRLKRAC